MLATWSARPANARRGHSCYPARVHLLLAATDSRDELRREIGLVLPEGAAELSPGLFSSELASTTLLPELLFARQQLPSAREVSAPSVRTWATLLADALIGTLPDGEPWSLHVVAHRPAEEARIGARAWHSQSRTPVKGGRFGGRPDRSPARARPASTSAEPPAATPTTGQATVGEHRGKLIREALTEILQKKRRHLLRNLREPGAVFLPNESLVQLLLLTNDSGFLSVAPAPLPFEQRRVLSPFAGGEVPLARDPKAPSRAFAKLVEAEARLGRRIEPGETCVDLGASPGGWTYVAVQRGARVTAVDRSELRPDLQHHPLVRFVKGDAFRFTPDAPVDWLVCDVIASAARSAEMLLHWLEERWCRHFVVTLKLGDGGSPETILLLRERLPTLTSDHYLLRLSANKKEVCAFGSAG